MTKRRKKGKSLGSTRVVVVKKDSRLGNMALGAFGLLVFGLGILLPALILREDGIVRGFIR